MAIQASLPSSLTLDLLDLSESPWTFEKLEFLRPI
jgi:hypothetical protein